MAIDQRDVSSTLRFMDDRALQQYAALHKNDPYIFPLAFQESQNRQRLRMQQQAAQAMQPQPKVTEQALAQMAPQPMPETQGIGALPARNMQQMADGGIAGYDDDANFAQRSEPVVMMAGGGHVQGYAPGGLLKAGPEFVRFLQNMGVEYMDFAAAPAADRAALADMFEQSKLGTSAATPTQAPAKAAAPGRTSTSNIRSLNPAGVAGYGLGLYSGELNTGEAAELARRRAAGPTLDAQTQTATFTPAASRSMLNQVEQAARKDPAIYGTPSKADAAPKVDTTRRNTADLSAVRKEPASEKASEPTGLDALVRKHTRDIELAQGALQNRRVQLASQLEQEALDAKTEGEKRRKERGDVFASREARLAEREKGIAGLGDKYMGLALLQAGAAMMSTPGNLGSVLGKGIQVGSERYIAGIDKINAAKDKFAEARDRLDDLRLNRDDMNEKEIKEENSAIRRARVQGQQLFLEGATKDLEISNANMGKIFGVVADDLKTDKTIAADLRNTLIREGGANARAAMPTGADRTAMMLGTGNTPAERLESGMLKLQQITADKSGMAAVKVLADINAKRMPGEPAVTMEQLLIGAREFSSLMYGPKVADVAPTRARP